MLNPSLQKVLSTHQVFLCASLEAKIPKELFSSWNLSKASDRHLIHGGILQDTNQASVNTLDSFVSSLKLEKLNLIKIDVDGFELKVLQGGVNTITQYKPKLFLELTPYTLEEQGDSLLSLCEWLVSVHYELWDEKQSKRLPLIPEILLKKIPHEGSINVLAIPRVGEV